MSYMKMIIFIKLKFEQQNHPIKYTKLKKQNLNKLLLDIII